MAEWIGEYMWFPSNYLYTPSFYQIDLILELAIFQEYLWRVWEVMIILLYLLLLYFARSLSPNELRNTKGKPRKVNIKQEKGRGVINLLTTISYYL